MSECCSRKPLPHDHGPLHDMEKSRADKISKFLSLVLRHRPGAAGISLDEAGWTDVDALIAGCATAGWALTRAELDHVVATNAKKRFEFDEAGRRLRASQGHSVKVALGYVPTEPPELLYHGTVARFLPQIQREGLLKRERHQVHLSDEVATARAVGARRGKPLLLQIRAGAMHRAGHVFYLSSNGVWLTESVPVDFLAVL